MNQRIIYETDEGGVAVIIPSPEYLETNTIEDLAAKDVPIGKPYKIVDVADIPSDRMFRSAWEADITEPDGINLGGSDVSSSIQTNQITQEQVDAATSGLEYQGEVAFNSEGA